MGCVLTSYQTPLGITRKGRIPIRSVALAYEQCLDAAASIGEIRMAPTTSAAGENRSS